MPHLAMLDPATVLSLFRRMTDEDCWQHLQLQVVEYINSDEPCLTNNIVALINDSKGRLADFRGNLSGKRIEYTGRTIIFPGPNLRIIEVACPVLMARVLTYSERVSYYNIEKLRQCIRNGPCKHPRTNFIIHKVKDCCSGSEVWLCSWKSFRRWRHSPLQQTSKFA